MSAFTLPTDNGRTANLILVALVHKLIEKSVLSDDDVRALLCEAAVGFDDAGDGSMSTQAARTLARSDLIPAFLGPVGASD